MQQEISISSRENSGVSALPFNGEYDFAPSICSSIFPPKHSSILDYLNDGGSSNFSSTESENALAPCLPQFQQLLNQDLMNSHRTVLSRLHDVAKQAQTLRQENVNLKMANLDLNNRLNLLLRSSSFQRVDADPDLNNLVDRLRRMGVEEEGTSENEAVEQSPTSVMDSGQGGLGEKRVQLPKSISVRSSGYLKAERAGGSGSGGAKVVKATNENNGTVLQLTKFDYRLSNDLDEELQKLRCRVNYHALRFTKPLRSLGQKVVTRMRKMTKRFIAVHLRFEPDMLAFSGCYYGGGDKERYELSEIRKRWETLPELSPDEERTRGKCPLTPHEVGLLLRALDFDNNTYLYVASGEIYGGEETLRPLKELFPNFYTKEMLASEELKTLLPFSSRLAAIDYIVCDESDVFVTNNNGNMAKILAGRRRYMGHKRTIRPNAKRLSALFAARDKMDWGSFSRKVKLCQRGFMGEPEEMRPGRGEFHEFPSTCICQKPSKYLAAMKDGTSFLNVSADDARYDNIGRRQSLLRRESMQQPK